MRLVVTICLALAAAGPETENSPQPIAVAIAPGPAHDAALRVFLRPYALATDTSLTVLLWDGTLAGLKNTKADLVLADGATLAAGCAPKLFAPLDWTALGPRDRFWPAAATSCGAGAFISSTVLAWDHDKLQATPDWRDFWDVAKHPGRRALRKTARTTLEIALLADGVAPGDVYRTLRDAGGVDRAFRKLDQLKPYILWWDQPAQAAQMLATGKVLLAAAPSFALPPPKPAGHGALGVQWGGNLREYEYWAVPAGNTHLGTDWVAIDIASDAARQAEFARATGFGPATLAGFSLVPAATRLQSPSLPAHLAAGVDIDEAFWAENGAKLEARFAAWLGK